MLSLNDIRTMDADALLEAVVDMYDLMPVDKAAARIRIRIRAKELGMEADFNEYIRTMDEVAAVTTVNTPVIPMGGGYGDAADVVLRRSPDGKVSQSIENFCDVMRNDPYYSTMRRNLMSGRVEIEIDGQLRMWNDAVDSMSKAHMSCVYGLRHASCHQDAFNILSNERAYNPVIDMLESLIWDNVPRIDTLLIKWLKCEDTPYTREVSRLIFSGGVHRAFEPGCKFDEVPILIGERQGEGKSTFIRWLAMDDTYFHDIMEVEGQKGIEAISGAWICEISELLALKRAKDVEAIKSYISRQADHYRRPFERFPDDYPRRCIFIGTTNNSEFLADRTGNRRFYPIKVYSSAFDLYAQKEEIQRDIVQSWAEAVALYRKGKLKPHADYTLMEQIRQAQEAAVEEDARIGLIEQYLEKKREGEYVCTLELWVDALGNDYSQKKPDIKKDLSPLLPLMNHFSDEWVRLSQRKYVPRYGQQRVWQKQKKSIQLQINDI